MPALPTNLCRVGAVYKYRARVPQDLLGHFHPKKEVTESLRTKSLAEARRLLPSVQLRYQQEWDRIRARLRDGWTELPINDVTIAHVSALFAQESLAGDERTRLDGNYTIEEIQEYRQSLTEAIACLRDAAAIGDLAVIRPALDEYLRLKRIRMVGTEEEQRRLALAYLRGAIATNAALVARMNGESIATPAVTTSGAIQVAVAGKGPGVSMTTLYEYWRDAVPKRRPRTVDDFRRRVEQLDELTGGKPADQLTKSDLVKFRDAMLAKGKTPATVEKDVSFLKTILRYAHDSDRIPTNPAASIKVIQAQVSARTSREIGIADLKIMFNSTIYTQGQRPSGGGGEAAFWLPLLGLYTGARLEELCQLKPEDIGCQDGIDYLRIIDIDDPDEDLSTDVKTAESRRQVPLHPALVKAGFLTYVEHVRAQRATWLFPGLKADTYNVRGAYWSKWWTRWRRALGVAGRAKCFHAFRHAFKTACREAEIEEGLHDALTGHASGGIGRQYGRYSLKARANGIRRLDYPGFEFAWVWSAAH